MFGVVNRRRIVTVAILVPNFTIRAMDNDFRTLIAGNIPGDVDSTALDVCNRGHPGIAMVSRLDYLHKKS